MVQCRSTCISPTRHETATFSFPFSFSSIVTSSLDFFLFVAPFLYRVFLSFFLSFRFFPPQRIEQQQQGQEFRSSEWNQTSCPFSLHKLWPIALYPSARVYVGTLFMARRRIIQAARELAGNHLGSEKIRNERREEKKRSSAAAAAAA